MKKSYRNSSVIKKFGNWVVTAYGVEYALDYYAISKQELDQDWESIIAGKKNISNNGLKEALQYAKDNLK